MYSRIWKPLRASKSKHRPSTWPFPLCLRWHFHHNLNCSIAAHYTFPHCTGSSLDCSLFTVLHRWCGRAKAQYPERQVGANPLALSGSLHQADLHPAQPTSSHESLLLAEWCNLFYESFSLALSHFRKSSETKQQILSADAFHPSSRDNPDKN